MGRYGITFPSLRLHKLHTSNFFKTLPKGTLYVNVTNSQTANVTHQQLRVRTLLCLMNYADFRYQGDCCIWGTDFFGGINTLDVFLQLYYSVSRFSRMPY